MALVMENQQPLAPMPTPPLPPPPPPPLPPQAYKHRCKVCKKGFVCGRALGGHMRAHGVTDDDALADADADDSGPGGGGSTWDSPEEAAAAKRMYSLRTNAGRHKNCSACENCGKEFTSWKSLLDHGRCNSNQKKHDVNIVGAADIDGEDEEEDLALAARGWSKGKRTRRTKVIVVENGSPENGSPTGDHPLPATSREEEDLANCLVMLSSSRVQQPQAAIADAHQQPHASTSKDEGTPARKEEDEQRFLAPPPQPISMLPPTVPQFKFLAPPQVMPSSAVPRGLFECKACKKVFTSHQALGGHRASHKKVKGCFAAKLAESSSRNDSPQPSSNENVQQLVVEAIPAVVDTARLSGGVDGNAEVNMINARATAVVAAANSAPEMAAFMQVVDEPASSSATVPPFKKKGKVHECSVCHRVFTSGQALGGHKRCHWLTTAGAAGDPTAAAARLPFVTQDHVMHAGMCQQLTLGRAPMYGASGSCLDLNVPMHHHSGDLHPRMLGLNAPAATLYMHSWAAHTNASNMHNNTAATSSHYDVDLPETAAGTDDDEADSGTSAKRAKMSNLKDMNVSGETSPWLQVGIALPPSETSERLLEPKG